MSRETVVVVRCDLCGREVDSGRESVTMEWNGERWSLDLCDEHLSAISRTFDDWLSKGRRVGEDLQSRRRNRASSPEPRTNRRDRALSAAMRAWALENGYKVRSKGRLPREVVDAYRTAS